MTDLKPLLWPESVAIIGASPNDEIIRGRLVSALTLVGYQGRIYPVNPSHDTIQGLKAYPSIGDIPEIVDMAVMAIPAASVVDTLEECGAAGVRSVVIVASGFSEAGDDVSREMEKRIGEIADRYGIVLCGPNAEGFYNARAKLAPTFSPAVRAIHVPQVGGFARGRASVVAQSGGIGFSFFNRGQLKGLDFNYVVSTGNEVRQGVLEFANFMLDEGETDILLMFLEGLRNPALFAPMAEKAAEKGVPLIIVKVGRSHAGQRAAASHTASLTGSDTAYEAMFRRYGITRADSQDEMLDIAAAFANCPLPRGNRVCIVTASGGGGGWMADACAMQGLELPILNAQTRAEIDSYLPDYGESQNPVDLTAQVVRKLGYAKLCEVIAGSGSVDAIIMVASLMHEETLQRDIDNMARLARDADIPIMVFSYTLPSVRVFNMLAAIGIPCYTSVTNCARALRALVDYADFQRRRTSTTRHVIATTVPALVSERLTAAGPVLCEYEAKELLAAYGVPMMNERLVASAEEAVASAEAIGFPVVLKVQSPDIMHKTDAGVVALNLETGAAVRGAHDAIMAKAAKAVPDGDIRGVLVQKMLPPGREMILGISNDPDFGPLLMIGMGGIYVELYGDVVFTPAPVTKPEAIGLIRDLRGAKLLAGMRGQPPADIEALADLAVALSRFAADWPNDIKEIDLNPVIVYPEGRGLAVVDALIVRQG